MAPSYRIVTSQLVAAVIVVGGLAFWDRSEAVGAALAGVVCCVPNALLAWRATVERSPARLVGLGVLKIVATLVLMAAAFVLFAPPPGGFFGTFILLQVMHAAVGATSAEAAR